MSETKARVTDSLIEEIKQNINTTRREKITVYEKSSKYILG